MNTHSDISRAVRVGMIFMAVAGFVTVSVMADALAQTTSRVSVNSSGEQGNNGGCCFENGSGLSTVSADGRHVAFYSESTNLVPGDTNGVGDVFVRGRQTGTTRRVSVASSGVQVNGQSGVMGIGLSDDGGCIAFASSASNLVTNVIPVGINVFVHCNGATEWISRGIFPSLSGDGRYVAFTSDTPGLVPDDRNGLVDVFVRDRQTGATERISVSSNGVEGNYDAGKGVISGNGRYVAFESRANNLVSGDGNGLTDIFVHDRVTRNTERVSVSTEGYQTYWDSNGPSISLDGRYVAFNSLDDVLVQGDTNNAQDVFVHDRVTRVTTRVSVASDGAQGIVPPGMPLLSGYDASISGNGRYVVFSSHANNLIPDDTNSEVDVFIHDRGTGITDRVSVSASGQQANGSSFSPSIDGSGRYATFTSYAENLVPGDTNQVIDVFVRDRGEEFENLELRNISTRARVETGDSRMIAGFIIEGNIPKQVILRGRGPSMGGSPFNMGGTLANPLLRVFNSTQEIARNDNWQDQSSPICATAGYTCGSAAQITATGMDPCTPNPGQTVAPPNCSLEAALLITLAPGAYTAVLSGVSNGIGVGLVEVYTVDGSTATTISAISTRARVLTGDNRMIGGFTIGGGTGNKTVIIRARGPSMSGAPFGLSTTLANPYVRLYSSGAGAYIAQNDNWGNQSDPLCGSSGYVCGTPTEITATGMDPCVPNPGQSLVPPGCANESALLITLPPGNYTAVVSGVAGATGIGLVEVFEVSP